MKGKYKRLFFKLVVILCLMRIGPLISKFVACNFIKLFTHMKSYKNKNYEQALIETFLKFDDILKTEKVNGLLKKYHNTQLNQNFEIDMKMSFNYLQDENLLSELKNESANLNVCDDTMVSNDISSNNKIFRCFYFALTNQTSAIGIFFLNSFYLLSNNSLN